jgi:hypothetical protein
METLNREELRMTDINFSKIHQDQNTVLSSVPEPPKYLPGKSIVTTCYRNEIPSTYILLKELNRLSINLPIEVFFREGELVEAEILELSSIWPGNITFKKINGDAKNYTDKWGNVKGWSTKVYAVLESAYAENLWLDSDNFPIRNCVDLFDDEEYVKKGSLFWRDVYSIDRADLYCSTSDMWKLFNVTPNDGEPFESGQFLVNKPKVWTQLWLMLYFTEHCDLYYGIGGDAECWRMAWQHVAIKQNQYHAQFNYHASENVPYGFMPYGPFHKGVQNPWHKYGGGTVMVQRDRNGLELFNHRNIHKFAWTDENPYNNDVTNEVTYHMILRHMKAKYGVPNAGNSQ